jgi:hypothetical protein
MYAMRDNVLTATTHWETLALTFRVGRAEGWGSARDLCREWSDSRPNGAGWKGARDDSRLQARL